jgi:hypothetical protein
MPESDVTVDRSSITEPQDDLKSEGAISEEVEGGVTTENQAVTQPPMIMLAPTQPFQGFPVDPSTILFSTPLPPDVLYYLYMEYQLYTARQNLAHLSNWIQPPEDSQSAHLHYQQVEHAQGLIRQATDYLTFASGSNTPSLANAVKSMFYQPLQLQQAMIQPQFQMMQPFVDQHQAQYAIMQQTQAMYLQQIQQQLLAGQGNLPLQNQAESFQQQSQASVYLSPELPVESSSNSQAQLGSDTPAPLDKAPGVSQGIPSVSEQASSPALNESSTLPPSKQSTSVAPPMIPAPKSPWTNKKPGGAFLSSNKPIQQQQQKQTPQQHEQLVQNQEKQQQGKPLSMALSTTQGVSVPDEDVSEWKTQGGSKSARSIKESLATAAAIANQTVLSKDKQNGPKGGYGFEGGAVFGAGGQIIAPSSGKVSAGGLENRYGENNCYLNVAVQTLFRIRKFRDPFIQRYKEIAASRSKGLQSPAFSLLTALNNMLVKLSSSTQTPTSGVSLDPLKQALIHFLEAKVAAKNSVSSGATSVALSTSSRDFSKDLNSKKMGDASEALEDVITLLHEAEMVCISESASSQTLSESMSSSHSFEFSVQGLAPTVALRVFGNLLTDVVECTKCTAQSDPTTPFTGIFTHINTLELSRVLRGNETKRFDSLLAAVLESSDSKSCPLQCGATDPVILRRSLVRPVAVFTIAFGWPYPNVRNCADIFNDVVGSIDRIIDLRNVFYNMRNISPEPLPCRMRGIICFTDSHYVAFFDVSAPGTSGGIVTEAQWVCCNDERIFPVDNPIAECRQHLLQPQLLVFESLEVGEKLPVISRMFPAVKISTLTFDSSESWADLVDEDERNQKLLRASQVNTAATSVPVSSKALPSAQSQPSTTRRAWGGQKSSSLKK